jgi:hypothetical protein
MFGFAGDRRNDALGLGGFLGDGVVEGERPVEDAAGDLPAVGHLVQSRCVDRRLDLGRYGGLDGADKRHGVDRVDDGGTDGPQTARLDDQLLVVTVCHGLSR